MSGLREKNPRFFLCLSQKFSCSTFVTWHVTCSLHLFRFTAISSFFISEVNRLTCASSCRRHSSLTDKNFDCFTVNGLQRFRILTLKTRLFSFALVNEPCIEPCISAWYPLRCCLWINNQKLQICQVTIMTKHTKGGFPLTHNMRLRAWKKKNRNRDNVWTTCVNVYASRSYIVSKFFHARKKLRFSGNQPLQLFHLYFIIRN